MISIADIATEPDAHNQVLNKVYHPLSSATNSYTDASVDNTVQAATFGAVWVASRSAIGNPTTDSAELAFQFFK